MLSRKAEIKEGWQFSLFYPTIGVIQQCLSVITYDVTATHSSSFCTVSEKKDREQQEMWPVSKAFFPGKAELSSWSPGRMRLEMLTTLTF